MAKADPDKCHQELVYKALSLAGGDRQAAFSRYIQLHYRATGSLAPGCDAKDLQAMVDRIIALEKLSQLCAIPFESLRIQFTDWIRQTPFSFDDAFRLCHESAARGLPLPFEQPAQPGGNGQE